MTDYTLLPDQSSFAVHDVRDVTSKKGLAADYSYHWQAALRGKQNIKHARLSVIRWGVLDASSVVVHYDILHKTKRLIVAPDLIDYFWAYPMPYDFPVGLFSGWYHEIWPRHNWGLSQLSWNSNWNRAHAPLSLPSYIIHSRKKLPFSVPVAQKHIIVFSLLFF